MDATASNREPMTTSGQVIGAGVAATHESPSSVHGTTCATSTAMGMSPRRILTAASSSGSDPLASPSNEAISDLDGQMEPPVLLANMSGMAGSMLANQHALPLASNHPQVQARLFMLEKQYHMQKELLSRQFEEQCRLLDHEQQAKIQEEYLKLMMAKQQQEEVYEMQKKLEEEQKMKEKWEQIKNKRKNEESAVASTAVKLKLRQCLINKNRELQGVSDSPPEFRQWSTQHSSLEQHSPPTNTKWSPPLHLLNRYEDEYPLRKTVSEPSLKMRSSKLSLRQKVMQRNSQLMRRREMYRKRVPATLDQDSSPNSPPFGSQGSSVDMGILKEEPKGLLDSIHHNSDVTMSHLQSDRFSSKPSAISMTALRGSEAELELASMSSHYGSLPLVGGYFPASVHEGSDIDSSGIRMKAFELGSHEGGSVGGLPSASGLSSRAPCPPSRLEAASLTEAYVQALMLARSSLPRTRSEPIPLPVQLLLQQHQMLLQKQQEQSQRENHRLYLKQKLLQQAGAKKLLMENVDESAEGHMMMTQDALGCSAESEEEVDVIVIDDSIAGSEDPLMSVDLRQSTKTRNAFLNKARARTVSGDQSSSTSDVATSGKHNLERGHSCPVAIPVRDGTVDASGKRPIITGLVYDPSMLKHSCICRNSSVHPENPDRIQAIWSQFEETGLADKCQLIKSRRAMKEELQTCHSEAYVHMYGSSQRHRDPAVLETFAPRFCQLPCGGIGVDSDTVWNDQNTTIAARIAAGCVIELSYRVATGEIDNGFAIVRPPGHHAEDTQAMGFCYFNSIGIATKLLLDKLRMRRILIVDWDVHHGNSTQQLFYTDPRVLYISLHRHDNGNFFPGTGSPSECGIDRGLGFNVNIGWQGLPMGDAEYMAAFRTVVMPIAREYQPEIVMVSAGFDAAAGHPTPLGGYNLSAQCFAYMTNQLLTLAGKKVALVLEGGYELRPLCDSAEACLRALLEEPVDLPKDKELSRSPCASAVEALMTTIKYQVNYWPCLAQYSEAISWSYFETQHRWKEILGESSSSVSLGASASHQERPDSTTDIAEELEPMEDT